MILALLCTAAQASGLLYDEDEVFPLSALDAEVVVTGRVAEATLTYDFEAPGVGASSFAARLPEDAALTGLRYRDGEGEWVEASASPAAEQENEPGPWGDPRELLDGQVFVVTLPERSGDPLTVELTWQRLLAAEAGALSLTVPLDDGGLDEGDPSVSVSLELTDEALGDASLSPEGSLEAGSQQILASWSGLQSEAEAVTLTWAVSTEALGLRLWTYRPELDPFTGEAGDLGYALVVLTPGAGAQAEQIFSFVLDTSASMAGEPLLLAVDAGSSWIGALSEEDRFNLIPYQSQPWPFRARAPYATADATARGADFLERQEARGLSDPAEALTEALALQEDTLLQRGFFSCGGTAQVSDSAPPAWDAEVQPLDDTPAPAAYVVWLTDGGASSGETDREAIVDLVSAANGFRASVYAIGVGSDADEALLDAVTGVNRGEARLAQTLDEVPAVVAALQERIRHPALAQPTVEIPVGESLAPEALQDLSEGHELLLAFRYAEPGESTLTLRGARGAEDVEEDYTVTLPELDEELPAVARAWAQLRVADLDARYLAGETGLYSEIAALVETYGVASAVVTLSFGDSAGYEATADAGLAYGAGCGCGLSRRGRAGLGPLLALALVVGWRRRAR